MHRRRTERFLDSELQSLEADLQQTYRSNDIKARKEILNAIGNALQQRGEYDKALDYHVQDTELCRQTFDAIGECIALRNQAACYLDKTDHEKALLLLEEALRCARSAGSSARAIYEESVTLFQKGNCYRVRATHQQTASSTANSQSSQASDSETQDGQDDAADKHDAPMKTDLCHAKEALKRSYKKLEEARRSSTFQSLLAEIDAHQIAELRCRILGELGTVYSLLHDSERAIQYVNAARDIAIKYEFDVTRQVELLHSLASIYMEARQFEKSRTGFEKVIAECERVKPSAREGPIQEYIALAYLNLASVCYELRHYSESLDAARKATDAFALTSADFSSQYEVSLEQTRRKARKRAAAVTKRHQLLRELKEVAKEIKAKHSGASTPPAAADDAVPRELFAKQLVLARDIGRQSLSLGEGEYAVKFFRVMLDTAKRLHERDRLREAYSELGAAFYWQAAHLDQDQPEKPSDNTDAHAKQLLTQAIANHTAALELARELGDHLSENEEQLNIANARDLREDNVNDVRLAYEAVVRHAHANRLAESLVHALRALGRFYKFSLNDNEKAQRYLRKADTLARDINTSGCRPVDLTLIDLQLEGDSVDYSSSKRLSHSTNVTLAPQTTTTASSPPLQMSPPRHSVTLDLTADPAEQAEAEGVIARRRLRRIRRISTEEEDEPLEPASTSSSPAPSTTTPVASASPSDPRRNRVSVPVAVSRKRHRREFRPEDEAQREDRAMTRFIVDDNVIDDDTQPEADAHDESSNAEPNAPESPPKKRKKRKSANRSPSTSPPHARRSKRRRTERHSDAATAAANGPIGNDDDDNDVQVLSVPPPPRALTVKVLKDMFLIACPDDTTATVQWLMDEAARRYSAMTGQTVAIKGMMVVPSGGRGRRMHIDKSDKLASIIPSISSAHVIKAVVESLRITSLARERGTNRGPALLRSFETGLVSQTLCELNLSGALADDTTCALLAVTLHRLTALSRLDMSFAAVSPSVWAEHLLPPVAVATTCLTELSLAGNLLTDAAVECVLRILRNCTMLSSLDLHQCGIAGDVPVVQRFAAAIATAPRLERLNLSHNSEFFSTNYQQSITSALSIASSTSLRSLDLSALCPHTTESHPPARSAAVAKALSQFVRMPTLQTLQLAQNSGVGEDRLGVFIGAELPSAHSLSTLDLANCNVTASGVVHLSRGLATNTTLTELCLKGNQIDTEGAMALGYALVTATQLVSLDLTDCGVLA